MVPYMRMPGRASRRQYIYAERFTDRFDHGYQRAIRNADYKLIERVERQSRVLQSERSTRWRRTICWEAPLNVIEQSNLDGLEAQLAALLASR